ncbi:MAG: response regulator transcription factor [Ignavibacteria bacterium]
MNVLLIEDEKKISDFICKALKEEYYNVEVAGDGIKGQFLAETKLYDIIILDILLPKQDGWQTCHNIRESGVIAPILMLTSNSQTDDKVKGLNIGADDYLTKPFDLKEFLARIRAITRRNSQHKNAILKIDDLTMDLSEHKVIRDNNTIDLTAREFAVLEYLLKNKRHVMTRQDISESVWGLDFEGESNVVDTYIKFLRLKIDKGFSKPLIHTVIGVGYVIREEK